MLVRKLTENDLEAVWTLRLQSVKDHPEVFSLTYEETLAQGKEPILQRLRQGNRMFYLGAFKEGLVGMVRFSREEGLKLRHQGSVASVYVLPEKRGRGIGRALMQELIAQAKQLDGLEQLHLSVLTTNLAARRLYQSFGFEVYGTAPRVIKFGEQYLDEDLMMFYFR
ncbi:GNAT family N-acetyltransferase [Ktedonobacter racemifer]|jgi:ribosomal protein S18 acetylase RimI-like enzyme|uniref:GCN5-related N-acetyltransferase n=1 Tax=Ktedonobacter racemifer DSM 44963 TaxID=485913 RepID=D6TVH5_KTERA|nr:GNAT family N-acetyltransferase [Ktedonobacter racemifer]EFH85378.1 GCN5-related N-acetyltransferase [Ktedonobacter racemifer DSM 44963]